MDSQRATGCLSTKNWLYSSSIVRDVNPIALVILEHRRFEETLDSCQYCIESRKLQKHMIVATGLKVCPVFVGVITFFWCLIWFSDLLERASHAIAGGKSLLYCSNDACRQYIATGRGCLWRNEGEFFIFIYQLLQVTGVRLQLGQWNISRFAISGLACVISPIAAPIAVRVLDFRSLGLLRESDLIHAINARFGKFYALFIHRFGAKALWQCSLTKTRIASLWKQQKTSAIRSIWSSNAFQCQRKLGIWLQFISK